MKNPIVRFRAGLGLIATLVPFLLSGCASTNVSASKHPVVGQTIYVHKNTSGENWYFNGQLVELVQSLGDQAALVDKSAPEGSYELFFRANFQRDHLESFAAKLERNGAVVARKEYSVFDRGPGTEPVGLSSEPDEKIRPLMTDLLHQAFGGNEVSN